MPITKRVASTGASEGTPSSVGGDTWGGTWGATWGQTFYFGTPSAPGTGASPVISVTSRVSVAPGSSLTSRVSGVKTVEIALSGDQSGNLLGLSGDQLGNELAASGDATDISISVTTRVQNDFS